MHTPILGAAVIAAAVLAHAAVGSPPPRDGAEPAERNDEQRVFLDDVEALARGNRDFRRVAHTGKHMQLVLMSLRPGEDIGLETHTVDQCLFVVEGEGEAIIDGERRRIHDGSVVCVPAGASHDIVNRGAEEPMKLFTVYSPPQHPDRTVHPTKAEAEAAEAAEHGAPTRSKR